MNEHASPSAEGTSGISASSLTILDIRAALLGNWKGILTVSLISMVGGLIVALLLPNWYVATTKILPPQQNQSSALSLLGQLGGLAGTASQALGLKNPSDTYVAMLKSRTIADRLVERFSLKTIYDESLLSDTRKKLAAYSTITAGRDGLITIEVEDKDPKRAADMANAYVEELQFLSGHLAVTEASQRRVFFEGQLNKAKNDLAASEVELKKFTQEAGLVNPPGQISLSVAAAAALRGQIAAKEIQLSAMRTFATDANPELKRTLQELNGLRAELGKMEKDAAGVKGDVMVPFGKAPEVGLEYVRRYRDTKYHETLYEAVAKQYEIARIDEARDAAIVQILDAAIPADKKTRPKRALITIGFGFVAFLLASVFAVVLYRFRNRT